MRGHQAEVAGLERPGLAVELVGLFVGLAREGAVIVARVHGRELRTVRIRGQDGEARGGHAQRFEDVQLEELVEGHARDLLHQIGLHVDGVRVQPARARLVRQRHLRELLRELGQRVGVRARIDLPEDVADRRLVILADETRGMAQHVANGDLALQRLVLRLAGIVESRVHLLVGELGRVQLERLVELELAALVELHQRHAGDRLGHGEDLHDGVARHRLVVLAIGEAEGAEVHFAVRPGRPGAETPTIFWLSTRLLSAASMAAGSIEQRVRHQWPGLRGAAGWPRASRLARPRPSPA